MLSPENVVLAWGGAGLARSGLAALGRGLDALGRWALFNPVAATEITAVGAAAFGDPSHNPLAGGADLAARALALTDELRIVGHVDQTSQYFVMMADDLPSPGVEATFGASTSANYAETFFAAYPELRGQVVVHHAVEQGVLTRFPGLVTASEMHSLENLRAIPNELNADLHLSVIRLEWNRFYRENANPTRQQLLGKATEIDMLYGYAFMPPVGW